MALKPIEISYKVLFDQLRQQLSGVTSEISKQSSDAGRAMQVGFSTSATQNITNLAQGTSDLAFKLGALGAGASFAFQKLVTEGAAAERATDKLRFTITQLRGESEASVQSLLDQATALSRQTASADDDVIAIQTLLGVNKATTDQILQFTPAILDTVAALSAFGDEGVSAQAVTFAIGKALQGEFDALGRVKIVLDDATKAQLDQADAAGRAAIILGLLQRNAGSAARELQSTSGLIRQTKNEFGELAEGIGDSVLPAVNVFLRTINTLLRTLNGAPTVVKAFVGGLVGLTAVSASLLSAVGFIAKGIFDLGTVILGTNKLWADFTAANIAAQAALAQTGTVAEATAAASATAAATAATAMEAAAAAAAQTASAFAITGQAALTSTAFVSEWGIATDAVAAQTTVAAGASDAAAARIVRDEAAIAVAATRTAAVVETAKATEAAAYAGAAAAADASAVKTAAAGAVGASGTSASRIAGPVAAFGSTLARVLPTVAAAAGRFAVLAGELTALAGVWALVLSPIEQMVIGLRDLISGEIEVIRQTGRVDSILGVLAFTVDRLQRLWFLLTNALGSSEQRFATLNIVVNKIAGYLVRAAEGAILLANALGFISDEATAGFLARTTARLKELATSSNNANRFLREQAAAQSDLSGVPLPPKIPSPVDPKGKKDIEELTDALRKLETETERIADKFETFGERLGDFISDAAEKTGELLDQVLVANTEAAFGREAAQIQELVLRANREQNKLITEARKQFDELDAERKTAEERIVAIERDLTVARERASKLKGEDRKAADEAIATTEANLAKIKQSIEDIEKKQISVGLIVGGSELEKSIERKTGAKPTFKIEGEEPRELEPGETGIFSGDSALRSLLDAQQKVTDIGVKRLETTKTNIESERELGRILAEQAEVSALRERVATAALQARPASLQSLIQGEEKITEARIAGLNATVDTIGRFTAVETLTQQIADLEERRVQVGSQNAGAIDEQLAGLRAQLETARQTDRLSFSKEQAEGFVKQQQEAAAAVFKERLDLNDRIAGLRRAEVERSIFDEKDKKDQLLNIELDRLSGVKLILDQELVAKSTNAERQKAIAKDVAETDIILRGLVADKSLEFERTAFAIRQSLQQQATDIFKVQLLTLQNGIIGFGNIGQQVFQNFSNFVVAAVNQTAQAFIVGFVQSAIKNMVIFQTISKITAAAFAGDFTTAFALIKASALEIFLVIAALTAAYFALKELFGEEEETQAQTTTETTQQATGGAAVFAPALAAQQERPTTAAGIARAANAVTQIFNFKVDINQSFDTSLAGLAKDSRDAMLGSFDDLEQRIQDNIIRRFQLENTATGTR